MNEKDDYQGEEMLQKSISNRRKDEKYTMKYRFAKTVVLILAWVSLGINLEMIGPTLEDLKIYLNIDYTTISLALILRNCSYMGMTILFGLFINKLNNYYEIVMACSSAIMALASLLIPITRIYFLIIVFFMMQGISQAIYDVVGNDMILKLWSGISTSPINAMHAGYGIGAILAIIASKNYIVFSDYDRLLSQSDSKTNSSRTMSSTTISSTLADGSTASMLTSNMSTITPSKNGWENINVRTPYWMAAKFALIVGILFLITQIFETKIRQKNEKNQRQQILLTEDFDLAENSRSSSLRSNEAILNESKIGSFIRSVMFDNRVFTSKRFLYYMYAQIFLLIMLFIYTQGYNTVVTRFMLTYLVLGPAKFNIELFVAIQILFWAFFVFGRLFAAYLAFKIEPFKFFFYMLLLNLAFTSLLIVPFLTNYSIFFWITLSVIGLTNGPAGPTSFMIAKQILDFNSFILSLFIVGMAIGGIAFQQITAAFLDNFHPTPGWMGFSNPTSSYVIPHCAFLASCLSFLGFIPVWLLYKKFSK